MTLVTCGYCRETFAEDRGQPACGACPLKSGCSLVRCPHCGFENPSTPDWILRLRSWFRTEEAEPLLRPGDELDVPQPAPLP